MTMMMLKLLVGHEHEAKDSLRLDFIDKGNAYKLLLNMARNQRKITELFILNIGRQNSKNS